MLDEKTTAKHIMDRFEVSKTDVDEIAYGGSDDFDARTVRIATQATHLVEDMEADERTLIALALSLEDQVDRSQWSSVTNTSEQIAKLSAKIERDSAQLTERLVWLYSETV